MQGGLTGEEFLCERYLADAPSALAEEEMLRESMAVATAQANMVKHMQASHPLLVCCVPRQHPDKPRLDL